ncbi:hypothetical protein A1F96_08607, partial [Pyrenophora tritici-repentis]
MAPTLGKRKRVTRAELERPSRSESPSSNVSHDDSGAEDLQAIFRRAFEAKFAPLPKKTDDDDTTEASLLKNDLALQKLLRESHILSSSASNPTRSLTATGAARHKSTDLHLQSLGAKGSVFAQKNMPMAQRKHMVQKARLGEEKRRSEAREAGIVLERESRGGSGAGKKGGERRERGVGGPSVGKFRG